MGTFVDYYGPGMIEPEKTHEIAQAVSKILYYGGMMHLRSAEMYGKKILLLDPVVIRTGEDVDFTYNYFEERSWENAGYIYGEHEFTLKRPQMMSFIWLQRRHFSYTNFTTKEGDLLKTMAILFQAQTMLDG